jgi:hypothetical protein
VIRGGGPLVGSTTAEWISGLECPSNSKAPEFTSQIVSLNPYSGQSSCQTFPAKFKLHHCTPSARVQRAVLRKPPGGLRGCGSYRPKSDGFRNFHKGGAPVVKGVPVLSN